MVNLLKFLINHPQKGNNMKKMLFVFLVLIFSLHINAQTATVNGQFVVVNRDTATKIMSVKLQLNLNERVDSLGSATIIFKLSPGLTFPNPSVAGTHYTFHNFSTSPYTAAKITQPDTNQLWVNIELNDDNQGSPIAQQPGWTDVVTFHCSTNVAIPSTQNITFLPANLNFAIFDNNNATLWSIGTLTNLSFETPVELTSFSLSKGDNEAILYWETATEKNNSGFEVERKIQDGEWQKIGFVSGKGTSTIPQTYTFRDKNLTESRNYYYRLKQVDYNGYFEYSKVMYIYIDVKPRDYSLSANYPNPFNPTTTIHFSIPENVHVTLQVYDAIGNHVQTLVDESRSAGKYEVTFDAAKLASGVYYYRLQAGQFLQTKKLLLMK